MVNYLYVIRCMPGQPGTCELRSGQVPGMNTSTAHRWNITSNPERVSP